jgi:hypothetical protein
MVPGALALGKVGLVSCDVHQICVHLLAFKLLIATSKRISSRDLTAVVSTATSPK